MHCLQQINVKKCPSNIQRWDLHPQPFEHELSPITTRPGLLYHLFRYCLVLKYLRRHRAIKVKELLPSLISKNSAYYWATFIRKFATKNFQKRLIYSHCASYIRAFVNGGGVVILLRQRTNDIIIIIITQPTGYY